MNTILNVKVHLKTCSGSINIEKWVGLIDKKAFLVGLRPGKIEAACLVTQLG